MFELLFLLLPIAAAYGWYMGDRNAKQKYTNQSNRLSREYVDGLNFLLSNQKDKAVDLFLDMLKEDEGTLEAHLTLGNLFRSRGEVDRAIRIHQALMESSSLSFEQRLLAIQQLGRDYMVAGLYDRAEEMFLQLIDEEDFQQHALQQLIFIYQSTSEWINAINTATKLVKLGNTKYKTDIAQFYCELASLAIANEDLEKAYSLLQKSAAADAKCARTSLMLGRVLIVQNKIEQAIESFKQILEQDKAFIGEALPLLKECYLKLNKEDEFQQFLQLCVDQDSGNVAELMLADIIEKKRGLDAAQNYMYRELLKHPNLKGFYRLMDYHVADAEQGRAKESLLLLRNMVGEQIKIVPNYRCQKCGFTVNSIYWLCPGCRSWSTIKPVRDFEQHSEK
ncbi:MULTISPECIES: lipopolysaccharide assembly protein LapB [unclassified Gilliamella]|uniref:lipopolysaccharide assembly protein LapB n=1 Tax=unclassified Gilliamella TaxID=2685620 RepID=UPI002269F0E1|nr:MULTISPECIES: lipopolysaccharide assembly protein LapB [unclassified Gilliamella]MCX8641968.1 lipopolysaccharide assembly protein LapB [Gilliamella sp. B3835]MCX8706905.1 lipopolysaccharide assembly protein LapB [Gilliamella sp. B3783]MCX8708764.1 lipopolysaccharide assembly protein LapB [Gilliamella sp. B3780]MCX8710953.1 lipopolysaccharide assembly protein LapB [Gilliamella sp. B3468]MCX8713547.1 lipopolysaccharide assembly protein LapB [Gilliamella sp. B3781]